MLAGRSTTSSSRTRQYHHSNVMRRIIFLIFCCTFLVVVDIEIVTSMSLDRLGIGRIIDDLQSDKKIEMIDYNNNNNKSDLIVEDLELEGIPVGGETDMYVLLPAGSKSERESVDKNIIESEDEAEPMNNMAEVGSDMIMMESNDSPVGYIVNLSSSDMMRQVGEAVNVQKSESLKVDNDESATLDENSDEPIKQVFKNDKDIEDMAFESDSERGNDSSEYGETGEGKEDSGEESESVVDMLADVVEEVEKEIETELVGDETDIADNKVVDGNDEEKNKWEETVEILEEKGSEKDKADEIPLETAAAVIEEIFPEEVVEAMALTDTNDSSSEEKDEDKKEVDKIDEDKIDEPIKDFGNENVETEITQEAQKETMAEKEKSDNLKEENEKNPMIDLNENSENEEKDEKVETVDKNLEESIETKEPNLEDIKKNESMEKEDVKGEPLNDVTNVETVNVINQEDTSVKPELSMDEEKPSDYTEEDLQTDNQNLDPNEENKETEILEKETEKLEKEPEVTKLTDDTISEVLQSEGADKVESSEGSERIEETVTSNGKESQEQKPEPISDLLESSQSTQSNEESSQVPIDDLQENKNDNKAEEIQTIENTANELKPVESTNGETEKIQSMEAIQIEESINHFEVNKNGEKSGETSTNLDGILVKPAESSTTHSNEEEEEKGEEVLKENMPSVEATTLPMILQIPALQQYEQQQQQVEEEEEKEEGHQVSPPHNEMDAGNSSGSNEQIASDPLPTTTTTQTTIESNTLMPQTVISATQDAVLGYVNATSATEALNSEMEQQQGEGGGGEKQQLQQENENSKEESFNSQLRRYDGAQVWRIVVQNERDRRLADELQSKYDGQLWKEVKQEVDYLLKPQVLAAAEKHIRTANLSRIVLIDNLQQVIEVENPPLEELADADNEKGYRLTWHAYHRLADIHEYYDYLAKTYPEICSVETIGYSVQRRPLKVLKISNGNAGNPGVWIDGGMHAREWISPASVTYIAHQLAEGWEDLPSYMQNINWFIHAVANPDGYEYTHTTDRLWRKNMRSHGRQCPGVDLNRNFGFKWGGKGTSANPCSQIYRGEKAFSEPETFYISKFISGFPRDTFQAYLSFHSYGQYILYPWGYDYVLTNDKSDLDRVGRAAANTITRSSGTKYTVGSSAATLYPAAGGSDDWAKGIANIKYSYTIEMGDNGRYGFILPASHIETNGKDAYTFVQTVARAISHDVRKRTIKL